MSVENILSLRFWIVGILLSVLFFAASRGTAVLRVLFFWIPTVAVSTLGFAFLGLIAYLSPTPTFQMSVVGQSSFQACESQRDAGQILRAALSTDKICLPVTICTERRVNG
jgi:hypothetical protein